MSKRAERGGGGAVWRYKCGSEEKKKRCEAVVSA